jgi:hypothetical protein
MIRSTQLTTKGGCGCTGAVATPAIGTTSCAACSCGGCSACRAPGPFVRPKFFSGQLLTEDDLGQLVEYVAGKNRLHNRFLFGDGVVCGLEVSCHPCGSGQVIVKPGYALDCCGDDIVVPCTHELDVNQMVRDLLRARTGIDCGDPCPPKSPKATVAPAQNPVVIEAGALQSPTERTYCLYVRYCEQPAEPVAPYTTDDPCAAQACEFSRVQEGYSFELRCVDEKPDRPGLLENLVACLDSIIRTPAPMVMLDILTERSAALDQAIKNSITDPEQGPIDPPDEAELNTLLSQPVNTDLHAEMRAVEAMAAAVLKHDFVALRRDVRPPDDTSSRDQNVLAGAVEKLRAQVARRGQDLQENTRRSGLPTISQDTFVEVAAASMYWTDNRQLRNWPREPGAQLLGGGFAMTDKLFASYATTTANLRGRIYDAVVEEPRTDCRLPGEVTMMEPPLARTTPFTRPDVESLGLALSRLLVRLRRFIRDCACVAVLPKCAPCDDTAVLLACVTVDDCKIVDVCNVVRRFVLAPTTLRYWDAPALEGALAWWKRFCCGETPEGRPTTDRQDRLQSILSFVDPTLAQAIPSTMLRMTVADLAGDAPAPPTGTTPPRRRAPRRRRGGA